MTSSNSAVISLLTWVKRIMGEKGIEETEIGTNKFVNPGFSDTKRYKAALNYNKDKPEVIDFILTINNVQPSDSGEIGCKIPTNNVEVFEKFVVFSPISELVMTSRDLSGSHHMIHAEGQNVTFQEGERRKFTCQVNGSYPAPKVIITIGNKDITELFVKEEKLLRKGEILGLKALTYETTLSNDSLEISYEFANKKLQCKAIVDQSPFDPVSQSILVQLTGFTPKFECGHVHVASLHQSNVQIRCIVKAEPAAEDFKVYWSEKGENTNASLSQGKTNGHFTAQIEDGESSNEHVMSLVIDRVFTQHFREYIFEAENSLGRTQHKVTLRSDAFNTTTSDPELVTKSMATNMNRPNKDLSSTSDSYRVWASLLFTLCMTVFALL